MLAQTSWTYLFIESTFAYVGCNSSPDLAHFLIKNARTSNIGITYSDLGDIGAWVSTTYLPVTSLTRLQPCLGPVLFRRRQHCLGGEWVYLRIDGRAIPTVDTRVRHKLLRSTQSIGQIVVKICEPKDISLLSSTSHCFVHYNGV